MSKANLSPFQVLAKQIKPLGGEVTSGLVTAVVNSAKKCTVKLPDGAVVGNVPFTGGRMSVGQKVWMVRNGTTLLAVGATIPAITFSTGPPTGEADVGSVHFNTSNWSVYSYV